MQYTRRAIIHHFLPHTHTLTHPSSYTITLEFQTVSEDSLLLYSQGSSGVFADYMALELSGGRLFHSFNLGSGRAYLLSSGRYNDGFLHMVGWGKSLGIVTVM